MNKTFVVLARVLVVTVVFGGLPAVVGAVNASTYLRTLYEPPDDHRVPVSVQATRPAEHDPAKPTAVVLVGARGANVADALAPYETFAASGAFNVHTVAPERRRVPLTGGLDLVPDYSFAELDQRLAGRAADVVVVPAMPDATEAGAEPLKRWLAAQSRRGSLVLSVCAGANIVAGAGLLDGREAASHWFRINGLRERYPQVQWRRGTRYVDTGNVVSTGGVLSGIDGALRVIERMRGTSVASRAAAAVGWAHYSPGRPSAIPQSAFGTRDMIAGVNLSFRQRPDIGVLLTGGVGEIELASAFLTYTEASYAARTYALGDLDAAPVRSRHGLVFVPRGDLAHADGLERLVVPGSDAAFRADPVLAARVRDTLGLPAEYLHRDGAFAFDAALRDLARVVDVPTARWQAKTLEYPAGALELAGPRWPWGATLLPLLYGLFGLAVFAAVRLLVRRRRSSPGGGPAPAETVALERPTEMAGT